MTTTTVKVTEIRLNDRELTVSTVKIADDYYDTLISDASDSQQHSGHLLAGYFINHSTKRTLTASDAITTHRAAVAAAYDQPIDKPPPNPWHPAAAALTRVRAYLDALPNAVDLGAEIAHGPQFNTPGWPRNGYALARADIEALLDAVNRKET